MFLLVEASANLRLFMQDQREHFIVSRWGLASLHKVKYFSNPFTPIYVSLDKMSATSVHRKIRCIWFAWSEKACPCGGFLQSCLVPRHPIWIANGLIYIRRRLQFKSIHIYLNPFNLQSLSHLSTWFVSLPDFRFRFFFSSGVDGNPQTKWEG